MFSMNRIQELAEILGLKDPRVRQLMNTAQRVPRSRDTVGYVLQSLARRRGIDLAKLPAFGVPYELPTQGIELGSLLLGESEAGTYRYPAAELPGNLGVFGAAGTGKSSLVGFLCESWIRAGLTVVILDVADEYGWLAERFGPERLAVVSARSFPLPFFENPRGSYLSDQAWLSLAVSVIREVHYVKDGGSNLLLKVVGDMYRKRGVEQGSRDYPLTSEVFRELTTNKFSVMSRNARYLETLVNRFHGMMLSFPGLNAKQGIAPAELLSRSLVVRMADLSPLECDMFSSLFLAYLLAVREADIVHDTDTVLVLEEAHSYCSEQKEDRYDMGEPIVVRHMRTGRKYGFSTVVVDQTPSELPPAVLGNLATRVCFRLTNPPCIKGVAYTMGLQRYQTGALTELERRQAVVQSAGIPQPFLLRVREIERKGRPGADWLRERERESLAQFDYELAGVDVTEVVLGKEKEEEDEKPAIRGDLYRVLARMCENPCELIAERAESLGLDRSREQRARSKLKELGMIQEGDTVGSRWSLYVPTAKGEQWARNLGLPVRRFKSGVGHEFMLTRVQRAMGTFSQRVSFVSAGKGLGVGRVQPDAVVHVKPADGGGPRVLALQVNATNRPGYEARQAVALARIEQVDRVVVVARNKGARKSVEQHLDGELDREGARKGRDSQEEAESAGLRGKIAVLDFETCVKPEYEWDCVKSLIG